MQQQELEKKFEAQIRQHEMLIYKVCRMYAYTNADREDLYQDIVVQVWKAYPKFRGDSAFSTWLYRVAINTAITRLKKQDRFITTYEPDKLPGSIDENTSEDLEKLWQQLYAAIDQLNEIEKAIVMLYMEDYSYAQMEEILGISQGTLRVKMNRIKDKLRELTKSEHGT